MYFNQSRLRTWGLLGVVLTVSMVLSGCESEQTKALNEQHQTQAIDNALHYAQEKYDLGGLEVVSSHLVSGYGLFGSYATNECVVELNAGTKTFTVLANADKAESAVDNYQAEEIQAALEEVIRGNLQEEPEEVRLSYGNYDDLTSMLHEKYEAPNDLVIKAGTIGTKKEEQLLRAKTRALRKLLTEKDANLEATVLLSGGDDSYIEEETRHIVEDIFQSRMTFTEKVYQNKESYELCRENDSKSYLLAPFIVGEVTGTQDSDGEYSAEYVHPEVFEVEGLQICVEGISPSRLRVQKDQMSPAEIDAYNGWGIQDAKSDGVRYHLKGIGAHNVYVFAPKDQYPLPQWRIAWTYDRKNKDGEYETKRHISLDPQTTEAGDLSCFQINQVQGDEVSFCFLYED